ncbi:MAG: queuosine salvage family protein, partial [Thermodesulfobacteriota bacterium]|nr:queuosine salvage family protein [Thermodesulfobacteriota bacterium]
LLAEKLTSFQDVSEYEGQEVFFYKRAQILAADLHGAFDGKGQGAFHDMDQLTAFADYKLPQVLRHAGVLRYAGALAEKVDQEVLLAQGSGEEVEVRANTIWAVELIRQELERMGESLRAFEIDGLLWNLGQGAACRTKPYHKTVTIFY